MTGLVSESLLPMLSQAVSERLGLYFPRERWRDLERGLAGAAKALDFKDVQTCAEWLLSAPLTQAQTEALASHLTVGETYFVRIKQNFRILEEHILPELLKEREHAGRHLRIWSAGCCTGEEAYSIAIALANRVPRIESWNASVLGTDINPKFLRQAEEGEYGVWSFRDTPEGFAESYFLAGRQQGRRQVRPEIKRLARFAYLNLAEDAYPSLLNNTNAVDVIFCCNVLMYFSPERIRRVVDNFRRALVPGGWLLVSPFDTAQVDFPEYETVRLFGATAFRKKTADPVEFRVPPPELAPEPELAFAPEAFHPLVTQAAPPESPAIPPAAVAPFGERDDKVRLALAMANAGRLSEALRLCEAAIAYDILNPAAHYLFALICQECGKVNEAIRALKQALYLDQDMIVAHLALGHLARLQGRRSDSFRHYRNALELLRRSDPGAVVPDSDGMRAGRLVEVVERSME